MQVFRTPQNASADSFFTVEKLSELLLAIAAAASLFVGLLTFLAWHLDIEKLLQPAESIQPQSYPASFLFVLVGMSLWLLLRGKHRASFGVGVLVLVLTVIILAAQFMGIELRMQQLFSPAEDFIAGRPEWMHVATSVSFILMGSALIFLTVVPDRWWRPVALLGHGLALFFISGLALLARLTQIEPAFGWSRLTMMPEASKVLFLLLGLALILSGWPRWQRRVLELAEVRKSILAYTALGALTAGLVSGALVQIPLQAQLQADRDALLISTTRNEARHLIELTDRARSFVQLFPSGIPPGGFPAQSKQEIENFLRDLVINVPMIVGATLIDDVGGDLGHVGRLIPQLIRLRHTALNGTHLDGPWEVDDGMFLDGPWEIDNAHFLVVSAPSQSLRGKGRKILLIDMGLFLDRITSGDQSLLPGQTYLAFRRDNIMELLGPNRRIEKLENLIHPSGQMFKNAVVLGLQGHSGSRRSNLAFEENHLITYTSVPGMEWAVVRSASYQELYGHTALPFPFEVGGILLLLFVGVPGVIFLVRPISAEILSHTSAMQDTIRARTRDLIQVSEWERQRLGQDLHDGLGQQLTGIAFFTKSLERRLLEKSLPEAEQASEIGRQVSEALVQCKTLAQGLFAVELERKGMEVALRDLAEGMQRTFGIRIRLEFPETIPHLQKETLYHIYRIAQEAMTNAFKHGRAQNLLLELDLNPSGLRLAVLDDGIGFPEIRKPADPAKRKRERGERAEGARISSGIEGMGLHTMRHRAALLGASLSIDNASGGGALVQLIVPESRWEAGSTGTMK